MFGNPLGFHWARKSLLRVYWSVGAIYMLQTLGLWKEGYRLSICRQLGVGWNLLAPQCPTLPEPEGEI